MKTLVAGAGGLLGRAFVRCCPGDVIGIGRGDLDVSSPERILERIANLRPRLLINCAADTDVEAAEDHPERAHAVNAVLPGFLAEACANTGAILVHISSTGCYGCWKEEPYTEADPLKPTTIHHKTKVQGEEAVMAVAGRWMILRAGWLYGETSPGGKNFVRGRLDEALGKGVMFANSHQRGNPTFAEDVAKQAYHLIDHGELGLFNCVAHGWATRRDYVEAIVRSAGLEAVVDSAPEGYFCRRASVSPNETATNDRLIRLGLDIMPEWRQALAGYVTDLSRRAKISDA